MKIRTLTHDILWLDTNRPVVACLSVATFYVSMMVLQAAAD